MVNSAAGDTKKTFKTKRDAAHFVLGYLGAGLEGGLKYLRQGRIREARRVLSDCMDIYTWYGALPSYISASDTPTPTGGLPSGDKE